MQNRSGNSKRPGQLDSLTNLILIEQGKIPDPFYTHGKKSDVRRSHTLFAAQPLEQIHEVKEETDELGLIAFMKKA